MVCGVRIFHERKAAIHTERKSAGATWHRLFNSVCRDSSDPILASAAVGGENYKDPAQ